MAKADEAITRQFEALGLDEMKSTLDRLQGICNAAIQAKLDEMAAEGRRLRGMMSGKAKADSPTARPPAEVKYRGPGGEEYSGRGALPRWARDLGITDKQGLEPYKVA